MRTNVYIDGYNLYHRAIQGTPYKWLDLRHLSRRLLGGGYQINQVRYFTANVKQPLQAQRQSEYHRALRLTGVIIHTGTFYENIPKTRPLANPTPGASRWAEILDREEKGSDVNLASHLLVDAFDKKFEAVLIVSNDSDQLTPIQIVRKKFHKHVVIANPSEKGPFCLPGDTRVRIRESNLRDCQFPEVVKISGKVVRKPEGW